MEEKDRIRQAKAYAALPQPDELESGIDPIVVWAAIIKDKTEDGLITVKPDAVGKRIAVNLRTRIAGNIRSKNAQGKTMYIQTEIIYKIPPDDDQWIPTELLDFSES